MSLVPELHKAHPAAAALVIGQVHNLGVVYVPWAATMFPFLLMVVVLIWRPTGLAGSHV